MGMARAGALTACRAFSSLSAARGVASLSAALQERVTPAVGTALAREGYAVVDGLFGKNALRLRDELFALRPFMAPNATHLVRNGQTVTLQKHGILEVEAHNLSAEGVALAPTLHALSRDRTLLTLLAVYCRESLQYQTLKVQLNAGDGACFPLHTDSDVELDSRRLTCLFYLNEHWKAGDGGELVLYPFPRRRVVVEPLFDRCVLFSATQLLHRVLPSAVQRACFTVWLFARQGVLPQLKQPQLRVEPQPATLQGFMDSGPSLRKHIVKAVYRDEWAQSIQQSHPDTAARDAALQALHGDVAAIERVLAARFTGAQQLLTELRKEHATP